MNLIKSLLIVLTISFVFASNAQKGYKIEGQVDGVGDTVQLAYYWANRSKILLEKTVPITSKEKGTFTIKGEEPLKKGIYLIVLPGNGYFELVMNEDQFFSFSTDTTDFIKNMTIKGHEENAAFYQYLQTSTPEQMKFGKLNKKFQAYEDTTTKEARKARQELISLNKKIEKHKNDFVKNHPDFLITNVLTMMDEPDTPEMTNISDEEARKRARFYYYRDHFLDDVDLTLESTIRTPVLQPKLDKYKDLHTQHPDSLIKMVDFIIENASDNQEMFKYLVNHYTQFSEKSKVMCMDKLKWHMYNKYYLGDQRVDWLDSTANAKVRRYEYMMRLNHCGEKAPSLVMKDTLNKYHSLHTLPNKYKVVVFWSATCGHCKKSMPKLHELYERIKDDYDLEVYSVHIDKPEDKWKEFIKKHDFNWIDVNDPNDENRFRVKYNVISTPTFYLVDKDNTIIAKRFDVELLEKILIDLEKKK